MHLPNDNRYSHARASGIAAFVLSAVAMIVGSLLKPAVHTGTAQEANHA